MIGLFTEVSLWKNGRLFWRGPNRVTKAGRIRLAQLITQENNSLPSYLAIGDGSGATLDSSTALFGTEHVRVLADVARIDNTITWSKTFGSGVMADITVREVGIFSAAVAGLMLARIRPADFVIVPDDNIQVSWKLRIGDA